MLTTAFTTNGLAPGGVLLHPRSFVRLLTSVDGEDIDCPIAPKHMTHHKGSHNKADEVKVDLDSNAFDFPIRLIGGANLSLYYGLVEEAHDAVDTKDNLRFLGPVVDYTIDHEGRVSGLEAQDLSYLCRRKTYPVRKTEVIDKDGNVIDTVDPTPRYSRSLEANCKLLLSILPEFHVGGEPPLTFRQTPALLNANLAKLVAKRAQKGPIGIKPDSTIWEAIEHMCGLLGCHVRVELNEIVVRTSTEVFAGRSNKCTFIFGGPTANAFGPKFHKKPQGNRNGVRVFAVDSDTRNLKSGIFPPEAELRAILKKQPKHAVAAPKKPTKKARRPPDAAARDVYELDPGHYTQAALDEKAKAIWLERSRQEADGDVSTPIWTKENLELSNGDLITVKVDADLVQQIALAGNDSAAATLLQELKGYDRDAADALVRAAKKPSHDDWYAKEMTFEHPAERLLTVKFINLIEI